MSFNNSTIKEVPPLAADSVATIDEVEAALDEAAAVAIEDAFVDEGLLDASDEQRPFSSWIDGEWTGPQYDAVPLLEPANLAPYAHMVYARAPELHLAAESAARNAALWRGMPFAERSRRIGNIANVILAQIDELTTMIAREQGKPRLEALTHEIMPALDHIAFTIRNAERYHAGVALEDRHPVYAHKQAQYLYDPIGVVVLVTPDPLPFAVPLLQVVAALAMGNAVVLKPSERAPLSGLKVGELCSQAGIPPGVVNVVPAMPDETVHIVTHPKVDKVFVTGTVEAGQHLMAAAGCMPRPVVLMLSGKHPSIVAGDADIPRAARGIVWGALANCGQNCGAVERVFVEQSIASLFIERVLHEVDQIRVGSPMSDDVDLGPLASDQRRQEVHRQVREAVESGGRLLRGGVLPSAPGHFYPPTVLLDPPTDCRLMREETLGPVIPIVVTESLERAILLANESEYALTASGWTTSRETAERLMISLQAGVVTINDVLYSFGDPASTWSGYRKSGLGHSHGRPGLGEMARQRFVSYDAHRAEAPVHAYPYDAKGWKIARDLIVRLHGRSRSRRLGALLRLLRMRRLRARMPIAGLVTRRPKRVP